MMVAVLSMTAAMRASVESKLREFGANMVVMPKTLEMSVSYGGVNIASVGAPIGELTEEDATRVTSIGRKDVLRGVSPKLVGAIRIDGREFILVGVRFRDELKMKPWWRVQGQKPSLSRDILLGTLTARQLKKGPGDKLVMGEKEFRVAGILEEQFSAEDRAIFADLREAGQLFDQRGKVSFIEVSTWCAACPVETVVEQISAKLPHARVFAVKQLVEAELSQVNLVSTFAMILTAVVLVVGSLIMLLTMMASVRERTQEIGILRAIGFRQSHIMKVIFIEGVTVSLISSCLGAIIGSLTARILYGFFAGPETSFRPDVGLIGISVALSIVMGTLPTLYSARKAAQLDPATALRAI